MCKCATKSLAILGICSGSSEHSLAAYAITRCHILIEVVRSKGAISRNRDKLSITYSQTGSFYLTNTESKTSYDIGIIKQNISRGLTNYFEREMNFYCTQCHSALQKKVSMTRKCHNHRLQPPVSRERHIKHRQPQHSPLKNWKSHKTGHFIRAYTVF